MTDDMTPAVEVIEEQRHGRLYSNPQTRGVLWSKAGVAFLERQVLIAIANFPGPTPAVGTVEHGVISEAWIEHAMLPDGAYWPKALPRNAWSKRFILEEK